MNENQIKSNRAKCDVCGFVVLVDGHASRCRVQQSAQVRDASRRLAWYGDTVHRLDIQLVAAFMGVPMTEREPFVQQYASNVAMGRYVSLVMDVPLYASEHTLGTMFESRYCGDFRVRYLRTYFPSVCDAVLAAWQPPALDVG